MFSELAGQVGEKAPIKDAHLRNAVPRKPMPNLEVISEIRKSVVGDQEGFTCDAGSITFESQLDTTQSTDFQSNYHDSKNFRTNYAATHGSSSSTSSDFHKSESGTSYSTIPSANTSPSLTPCSLPCVETKHDGGNSSLAQGESKPGDLNEPYRNPVQIPGCLPTTFVYPHSGSSIDERYHNRYREVVNLFRRNIYEEPRLRESMQYIDYTLKLCGASPAEALPSIIAFCRKSDFKALNKILTNKELKYQYCLRRSSWRPPWLGQIPANVGSHKPLFNLYFWRQSRPRSLFWGQCPAKVHESENRVCDDPNTPSQMLAEKTICGSIIEIREREVQFSTLGCTLKIGSEWYTTTARHAFKPAKLPKDFDKEDESVSFYIDDNSGKVTGKLPSNEDESIFGSDTDISDALSEGEDYVVDDIQYESLSDDDDDTDDWDEEGKQNALDSYWDKVRGTFDRTRKFDETSAIFPTTEELDESNDLDLDWALVKWTTSRSLIPNVYCSPNLPRPIYLSHISESQVLKETPVIILTSGQSPRWGELQPGTAILGSISGRQPSIAWTVVPVDKKSLTYGDSGSIVINTSTSHIYGHVVGANPMGEVYISPYYSIVQQIQRRFPESSISMAGPIEEDSSNLTELDSSPRWSDNHSHHSIPDMKATFDIDTLENVSSTTSSLRPGDAHTSTESQSPLLQVGLGSISNQPEEFRSLQSEPSARNLVSRKITTEGVEYEHVMDSRPELFTPVELDLMKPLPHTPSSDLPSSISPPQNYRAPALSATTATPSQSLRRRRYGMLPQPQDTSRQSDNGNVVEPVRDTGNVPRSDRVRPKRSFFSGFPYRRSRMQRIPDARLEMAGPREQDTKLFDALTYQEDGGGVPVPLTAEALREASRNSVGSRRSTSSYATSRSSQTNYSSRSSHATTISRQSFDEDSTTIRVSGRAVVTVGDAVIDCSEGQEIEIRRGHLGSARISRGPVVINGSAHSQNPHRIQDTAGPLVMHGTYEALPNRSRAPNEHRSQDQGRVLPEADDLMSSKICEDEAE